MIERAEPFLRWAGSKRQLIPRLTQEWIPSAERYIEPFMGSACVFFSLNPKAAILSDVNPDLINVFNAIKKHPKRIYNRLQTLPLGKRSYYKIRAQNTKDLTSIQQAARFIFLNRFCFNGLYRTNLDGQFNVPFSGSKTGKLPSLEALRSVSEALKSTEIECCDFEDTLKRVRKNDFVYMDPPFAVGNRRIFRQYDPASFGLDDLDRLCSSMVEVDRRGANFVVSYAMCSEALSAFKDWTIRRTTTNRNISGFSKHRRTAVELIVTNN